MKTFKTFSVSFYEDCMSNLKTTFFFLNWYELKEFLYCIATWVTITVMDRFP